MSNGLQPVDGAEPTTKHYRETYSQRKHDWRLDRSLFVVVSTVLGLLMLVLFLSLYVQFDNYHNAIIREFESVAQINHASIISYSRALDFAVAKMIALFSACTLVLIGALYVLRIGEAEYKLAVGNEKGKGTLQTSSPGLVMVTLGAVLIVLVLNTKSTIEYNSLPDISDGQSNEHEQQHEKPPLSSPQRSTLPKTN